MFYVHAQSTQLAQEISIQSVWIDFERGYGREIRVARAKTFGQKMKSKILGQNFQPKKRWRTHWLCPPTVSLALLSETLPLEVQGEFSVLKCYLKM